MRWLLALIILSAFACALVLLCGLAMVEIRARRRRLSLRDPHAEPYGEPYGERPRVHVHTIGDTDV